MIPEQSRKKQQREDKEPSQGRRQRRRDTNNHVIEVVIIAGGGITGLCTAYYLAKKHRVRSIIVEWTGRIAPGASGKAAGFLARHWNDTTPTEALTHRSFDLHQELATSVLGAKNIQYRRLSMGCVSVTFRQQQQQQVRKKRSHFSTNDGENSINDTHSILEWFNEMNLPQNTNIACAESTGDETNIAQVTPKLFCEELWKAIQDMGLTTFRQGRVIGAVHNDQGRLMGARVLLKNVPPGGNGIDDHKKLGGRKEEIVTIIPGNALVYACGPWSANIMHGIKGHAVTVPTKQVLNQVIFGYSETSIDTQCEVFVRPNRTAFCTALPSDVIANVEEEPGKERVEPEVIQKVLDLVRTYSSGGKLLLDKLDDSTAPAATQQEIQFSTCYQPVTDDFLPVIGKLSTRSAGGGDGCYMASGNNCWGILLGPVTGECMADLVITGESKLNLHPFRPSRFRNLKPVPIKV